METSWRLTALTLNACIDITDWVSGLTVHRPFLFKHFIAVGTGILHCTDCSSILVDAGMTKNMSGSLTNAINLGCKALQKITLLQEPQITCTYYAYQMVSHQFALRQSWLFNLGRIMKVMWLSNFMAVFNTWSIRAITYFSKCICNDTQVLVVAHMSYCDAYSLWKGKFGLSSFLFYNHSFKKTSKNVGYMCRM